MTAPVSAVVVSRNEAHLLERCLDSLRFCEEIVVVDLESSDDTLKVAEAAGVRVIEHEWVPVVEMVREEIARDVEQPWILQIDPDEWLDPDLGAEIATLLPQLEGATAIVSVPWRFYFKARPLRGTVWGGVNRKSILLHRDRVVFEPDVHRGMRPREGFTTHVLEPSGDNVLHHDWMTGYREWLEKHLRYAREERAARRRHGQTTGVVELLEVLPGRFLESFVLRKGYRDGLRGLLLSAFWALYNLAAISTSIRLRGKPGSMTGALLAGRLRTP
jgi:glycosyltransferase involved in cell wall biosynthesis